jgi:DNA-binding XRE family transcriptional regulator
MPKLEIMRVQPTTQLTSSTNQARVRQVGKLTAKQKLEQAPVKTPRKGRINKAKVKELVIDKQLSQTDAATVIGCRPSRISQIMQEFKSNPEIVIFSQQKDKVFEGLQAQIINSIESEDIKKANLQQKIWATGVLQDKVQTLRGQATEIIDYRSLSLSGTLRELREARAQAIDQQKVINNEASEQVVDITNDIA